VHHLGRQAPGQHAKHATRGDKVFKSMEDYHCIVFIGDGQKGKGGNFCAFIKGGVGIRVKGEVEVFHGTVSVMRRLPLVLR